MGFKKRTVHLMIICCALVYGLSGCGSRLQPLPHEAMEILPKGALNPKGDKDSKWSVEHSLGGAFEAKIKEYQKAGHDVDFNILTLTGGGSYGAFGVGYLRGWQESGEMPRFDVVTGVSTGSIMATHIFLGGEEIAKIADIYTHLQNSDLYSMRPFNFFSKASVTNPDSLKKLIAKEIDAEILERVAREHQRGRRLYVGTTEIDSGRFVVWDMGAIASSDIQDKLQLYRDIVYASSAIPLFFPPQFFEVQYKGEKYYQMYVDGGLENYTFMVGMDEDYSKMGNLARYKEHIHFAIYTIANRKLHLKNPVQPVDESGFDMFKTMMTIQTDKLFHCSLRSLYLKAKLKGIAFEYVHIPDDIGIYNYPSDFDTEVMNQLYKTGYEQGRELRGWKKIPPL